MAHVNKDPLTVTIEKDVVVDVNGVYEKEFRNFIGSHPVLKFVSEISIGTNPIVSSVAELCSIIEEKNIGTAHIGNGGNKSYGKREGPHFDGVFAKPSITIGGNLIMEDGVPVDLKN